MLENSYMILQLGVKWKNKLRVQEGIESNLEHKAGLASNFEVNYTLKVSVISFVSNHRHYLLN